VTERQICRRCKTVFATTSGSPVTAHSIGRIQRIVSEHRCPKCGGAVIWVGSGGTPLSYRHRVADVRRHLGMALLWIAVAALLVFLWRRYGT
jgi:predicted RNA-binding Zn-ribbon protein involved in translation (DUF1610 family)